MSRRLIDRDALGIGYCNPLVFDDIGYAHGWNSAIEIIEKAPTIEAVELPCKIGDKVWVSRRYKCHKRPRWGIVSEMFFTEDMELCIVVKGVARGKWGVDVFATYEEAEKQIEINNRKD